MMSYVLMMDGPFYAITGEQGEFVMSDVPAGTYSLEAWHEGYGTKETSVIVKPGQTTLVNVTYYAQDQFEAK
jgi:hypothetical protein